MYHARASKRCWGLTDRDLGEAHVGIYTWEGLGTLVIVTVQLCAGCPMAVIHPLTSSLLLILHERTS